MKEERKYEVIKELVDHAGNKRRAAFTLGVTNRHINRLIKVYKEEGKSGFVHKNKGRSSVNSIPLELSNKIVTLYNTKYQGFNFSHFKDLLEIEEKITISYSCLYRLLTKNEILSNKAKKITKKRFRKMQEQKKHINILDEQIENSVSHELSLEESHPRKERKKYFGEEIQMDGSIHRWFGSRKTCLHLAIDNCTGIPVGAYFDYEETLNGYYNVFKQILNNYGIPYEFKTDNRTIFNYVKETFKSEHNDVLTQFGYSCKQLGVHLTTTSVSQAKGQVERANGTFQSRLVNELKLKNIKTIEEANDYLINIFIPFYKKRFALDETKFESVFEDSPTDEKINYTLAILSPRSFDNGSSIKYCNHYYQPYDKEGNIKCFMSKTKCLVIKAFDSSLYVSIDDNVYELRECMSHTKTSLEFDEVKEEKQSKKYIPPMSHPWKRASFIAYMNREHSKTIYKQKAEIYSANV